MKSIRIMGCVFMTMMGGSSLVAATTAMPKDYVIGLSDLNEEVIQDFTQGKMSEYILECREGTTLPLKITLKGEFLSLESLGRSPLNLKILKTCYVRCEEPENFLFSTDLETWKEFSEFFTGELKVSVDAQHGDPVAGVELELNWRKS